MIECNEKINFGMPALRGRRLTVYNIVTKLYYEDNLEITLSDYEISLQDVKDAVNYCINLKCKGDKLRLHFCDGCLLRTIEEGFSFNKDDYIEDEMGDQKFVKSKDGETFFLGSLQEFEDQEFGKVAWLIAEEVNAKFLCSLES